MDKIKWVIIIRQTALTVLLVSLYSLAYSQGSSCKSGEFIRISESDSLPSQLLAVGKTVEMLGQLDNDFFSAAELFTIGSTVTDDAVVAAGKVSVMASENSHIIQWPWGIAISE